MNASFAKVVSQPLVLIAGFFVASHFAAAQTQPAVPPEKEKSVIELNPFEVKSDRDSSYGALNSNSLTRFNTELNKVSVSADIFTKDFLDDVAVTSVEELLAQYGAGVGQASGNPEGDASQNQPGDRLGNLQIGVRGLAAGSIRRDGFTSMGSLANAGSTGVGTTSMFDIERVEVVRGPQGLLYGAGGAGGTVNVISKRAEFKRQAGSVSLRIDQYGSKQGLFDYNWGSDNVAVRVSLMDDLAKYRRLFIGGRTKGYYTQLAFRVPLHTTLRVVAERTENDRINATSLAQLKFNTTLRDPRLNYSLSYLLATNQTGDTDPKSGARYPGGAIANGISWENLNSWGGTRTSEFVNNNIITTSAESTLTPWLSTHFAAVYNDYKSDRVFGGTTGLTPPLSNGNPLNEWANSTIPQDTEQPTRRVAVRASALLQTKIKSVKSQTLVGFDKEWIDIGPTDFRFYLADQNFNVIYNPAVPTNLGRTVVGQRWWSVAGGPVKDVFERPGWYTPAITVNGQNYVRMPANPRDPAWVRPNNPQGLASLAGNPGVSGQNNIGHNQKNLTSGLYLTNYSDWFDDRFTTIAGLRANTTYKKNPNTIASYPDPYSESSGSSNSYNLGLNVRLTDVFRAFYGFSTTYQIPIVNANDPLGNPPTPSRGTGHELGLKFTSRSGRISGSLQYFTTNSKDEMFNAGTGIRDLINPNGRNGAHLGPAGAKDQWVNLDRTSNGVELIVTASPTKNWRLRFSGTTSDGQILKDKSYPMLYNDQFYVSNGVVTYQNGAPFLVPTDDATLRTRVATLTGQVDPASLTGAVLAPLTLAMINTVNGPYWAQPANDNGRITGNNLLRVLTSLVKPGAGSALTGVTGLPIKDIQYNWSDPFNTGGQVVVAKKGEKTVGYAQHRFTLTSMYTFTSDHWWKNIGLGGSINAGYKNRTYYYSSPDGIRRLYGRPSLYQFDGIVSYKVNIGRRYVWRTQVNVSNVFNHYEAGILPNPTSGYSSAADLSATLFGQPRMYVWTNSVSF